MILGSNFNLQEFRSGLTKELFVYDSKGIQIGIVRRHSTGIVDFKHEYGATELYDQRQAKAWLDGYILKEAHEI